MAKEDWGHCMFPNLLDNSKDFSVVDRLSIVISGRIGPLLPLILTRCKPSKQSIYFSWNDLDTPNLK